MSLLQPIPASEVRKTRLALQRRVAANRSRQSLQRRLLERTAASTSTYRNIQRVVMRTQQRIFELLSTASPTVAQVQRIIRAMALPLRVAVNDALDGLSGESRQAVSDEIHQDLLPPQLRLLTGLPVDVYGQVMSRPAAFPRIADVGLPDADLLRSISGLLWIAGTSWINRRNDPIDEIIGQPEESRSTRALAVASTPSVSRPMREKLTRIVGTAARKASSLLRSVGSTIRVGERIRTFFRQITDSVVFELVHEARRMLGMEKERATERLQPLHIGYELLSVKIPTSAPDHVLRDGWRFYRDNREGSNLPWSRRLIPPYRKNCLCFRLELYEDATGAVNTADFNAVPRISGARTLSREDVGGWFHFPGLGNRRVTSADVGRTIGRSDAVVIQPRDVGQYSAWFSAQRDGVKRQLMGDRRFFAAKSRSDRAAYEDFVATNGAVLNPREILGETEVQRRARAEINRQTFRQRTQLHTQAWAEGRGRWAFDRAEERRHRRRQEAFMRNLQAA